MRYYHGLIDTKLLSAGAEYDKLPNVAIIVILPYDPFDKKRMVYTIQNQCVEDTTVVYDDGAKKIFLYTKGTAGNPSQGLKDMLKYMEETTEDNVTNSDIARLHKLVMQVKNSKEVGINYMKSWEIEQLVREDGISQGIQIGKNQGIEEKTKTVVSNMIKRDASDEDIRAMAECDQKVIDEVRENMRRR